LIYPSSGVARNFWVIGCFPVKLFWGLSSYGQLKINWARIFFKLITITKTHVYWRKTRHSQLRGEIARLNYFNYFRSIRFYVLRKIDKHSFTFFISEFKWNNESFDEKLPLNYYHCDHRLNTKDRELISLDFQGTTPKSSSTKKSLKSRCLFLFSFL